MIGSAISGVVAGTMAAKQCWCIRHGPWRGRSIIISGPGIVADMYVLIVQFDDNREESRERTIQLNFEFIFVALFYS